MCEEWTEETEGELDNSVSFKGRTRGRDCARDAEVKRRKQPSKKGRAGELCESLKLFYRRCCLRVRAGAGVAEWQSVIRNVTY